MCNSAKFKFIVLKQSWKEHFNVEDDAEDNLDVARNEMITNV